MWSRPPSYLDARNFSGAFWQVVATQQRVFTPPAPGTAPNAPAPGQPAPGSVDLTAVAQQATAAPGVFIGDLKTAVGAMTGAPKLQQQLATLLSAAGDDYEKLLRATDGWFNAQMDRVSGWYTRATQYVLILLAFLLVSVSGVDTLEMIRTLSVLDPHQLASIADTVQTRACASAAADAASKPCLPTTSPTPKATATPAATPTPKPTATPAVTPSPAASPSQEQLASGSSPAPAPTATPSPVPNGTTNGPTPLQPFDISQFIHVHGDLWTNWGWVSHTASGVSFHRAPGMLLTMLALSLGGPFWFNALCTLANVRAAGRKPQRDDQPPK